MEWKQNIQEFLYRGFWYEINVMPESKCYVALLQWHTSYQ